MCVSVCVGTCAGGVRFSNSNRIIHSDYRILLLLKMHIPSSEILLCWASLRNRIPDLPDERNQFKNTKQNAEFLINNNIYSNL